MKIYNLDSLDGSSQSLSLDNAEKLKKTSCFIACSTDEIWQLQDIFGLDDDTLIDCANFDENIRFTSYKNYDFISFIFFSIEAAEISAFEVNFFIGKKFIIFTCKELYEHNIFTDLLAQIEERLVYTVTNEEPVARIYYHIFDSLLTAISGTLEHLEEYMQGLETEILQRCHVDYFNDLTQARKVVYFAKKQLRSMLYIGDQFVLNDNKIIPDEYIRYFNNLDIRLNKIYDFVNNLQEFAVNLLNLYESKISMDTNNVVNKLTIVTLFFGPPTVIAGIYGMNFVHMPELAYKYGYPMALGFMTLVTMTIYLVLKKKRWL